MCWRIRVAWGRSYSTVPAGELYVSTKQGRYTESATVNTLQTCPAGQTRPQPYTPCQTVCQEPELPAWDGSCICPYSYGYTLNEDNQCVLITCPSPSTVSFIILPSLMLSKCSSDTPWLRIQSVRLLLWRMCLYRSSLHRYQWRLPYTAVRYLFGNMLS